LSVGGVAHGATAQAADAMVAIGECTTEIRDAHPEQKEP